MWEASQIAALRKLWPGQQGGLQPELPIQGILSHWNPVPAVLSHWREQPGKVWSLLQMDPARQQLGCQSAVLPTADLSGAFPRLLQLQTKQGV